MRYIATVAKGLEPVLARELAELGAKSPVSQLGSVSFEGDRELLYRTVLWLRTASRVLVPLRSFACRDATELYEQVHAIPWHEHLTPEMTLAVEAVISRPQDLPALAHSHFVALKTKDAIVDQIRARTGRRPSVDRARPSLRIHVRIAANATTVSLDAAGTSLHERGYRVSGGPAPLKETLAAALVAFTNWTPEMALFNPMCGTGTLAIEAARMGWDMAPGLWRAQAGVQTWVDFDARMWNQLVQEAQERHRRASPRQLQIWASDRDPQAIRSSEANARSAGVQAAIRIERADLAQLAPPAVERPGIVIVNPPYGERLGKHDPLAELYSELGERLKHQFTGWTAYVMCGNLALAQSISLRTTRRIPLWNGPIECRLLEYRLY